MSKVTSEEISEANAIKNLAMGRVFRLLSRPYQPGDEEQFEMARRAFMDAHSITHGDGA